MRKKLVKKKNTQAQVPSFKTDVQLFRRSLPPLAACMQTTIHLPPGEGRTICHYGMVTEANKEAAFALNQELKQIITALLAATTQEEKNFYTKTKQVVTKKIKDILEPCRLKTSLVITQIFQDMAVRRYYDLDHPYHHPQDRVCLQYMRAVTRAFIALLDDLNPTIFTELKNDLSGPLRTELYQQAQELLTQIPKESTASTDLTTFLILHFQIAVLLLEEDKYPLTIIPHLDKLIQKILFAPPQKSLGDLDIHIIFYETLGRYYEFLVKKFTKGHVPDSTYLEKLAGYIYSCITDTTTHGLPQIIQNTLTKPLTGNNIVGIIYGSNRLLTTQLEIINYYYLLGLAEFNKDMDYERADFLLLAHVYAKACAHHKLLKVIIDTWIQTAPRFIALAGANREVREWFETLQDFAIGAKNEAFLFLIKFRFIYLSLYFQQDLKSKILVEESPEESPSDSKPSASAASPLELPSPTQEPPEAPAHPMWSERTLRVAEEISEDFPEEDQESLRILVQHFCKNDHETESFEARLKKQLHSIHHLLIFELQDANHYLHELEKTLKNPDSFDFKHSPEREIQYFLNLLFKVNSGTSSCYHTALNQLGALSTEIENLKSLLFEWMKAEPLMQGTKLYCEAQRYTRKNLTYLMRGPEIRQLAFEWDSARLQYLTKIGVYGAKRTSHRSQPKPPTEAAMMSHILQDLAKENNDMPVVDEFRRRLDAPIVTPRFSESLNIVMQRLEDLSLVNGLFSVVTGKSSANISTTDPLFTLHEIEIVGFVDEAQQSDILIQLSARGWIVLGLSCFLSEERSSDQLCTYLKLVPLPHFNSNVIQRETLISFAASPKCMILNESPAFLTEYFNTFGHLTLTAFAITLVLGQLVIIDPTGLAFKDNQDKIIRIIGDASIRLTTEPDLLLKTLFMEALLSTYTCEEEHTKVALDNFQLNAEPQRDLSKQMNQDLLILASVDQGCAESYISRVSHFNLLRLLTPWDSQNETVKTLVREALAGKSPGPASHDSRLFVPKRIIEGAQTNDTKLFECK